MKQNTIEKLKLTLCSGCSSCYNVCPKDAIQMVFNREGFHEPVIDHEKCIDCSLCEKTCPVLHPPKENLLSPLVYAVKGNKTILKESTSGGVFAILAEYILKNEGYVCGAAFDENFEVHHLLTNNTEGVRKIKKSKYVQSQTGLVFREIRQLLETGELVLFTGTPCQVAGLHTFLKKSYDNLYTMDIICHGAPAPVSWNRYLNENFDVNELEDIDFRHKGNHGFKKSYICFKYKNGKELIQSSSQNSYYYHFRKNLGLRQSCASCEFAVFPRQGDISAGDFWGAEKFYPELIHSDSGLSVMFINSEHGKSLFENVKKEFKLLQEITLQEGMASNRRHASRSMHSNRELFFNAMQCNTFDDSVKKTLLKPYDVALYGATVGSNYGGLATYYALYRAVQILGYSVVLVPPPSAKDKVEENHATRFCQKYMVLADRLPLSKFEKYNDLAEIFLLGSDQVWNYTLFSGRKNSFYLDFVEDSKKKIAYASSFGFSVPTIFPDYQEKYPEISFLMKKMDYISVREEDAVNICNDYFDVSATHVMDPVFLLSDRDYTKLARKAKNKPKGKYMAVYALTPKKDINTAFQFVSKTLDLPRVNMASGNPKKYEMKKKNFDMPYCEDLGLEEWLYNIKNSEFVITDSYHCVCFSIIFRKNFVIIQKSWAVSRIVSLLSKLNLTERWFEAADDLMAHPEVLTTEIDYNAVYDVLSREIYKSQSWLSNALKSSKVFSMADVVEHDQYMNKVYAPLYSAKDANLYFGAIEGIKDETIIVMAQKGKSHAYIDKIKFFKSSDIGSVTKRKMRGAFAYICDVQAKVLKKKTGDFAHVSYYYLDTQFTSISESSKTSTKDKVAGIFVENNGVRKLYPCTNDGLYVLVYSKLMMKVVDFIHIDVENDEDLKINH